MRVIIAFLAILFATSARAETVWNVKITSSDGGKTQLRSIDGNPNDVFPACPCVAGVWTATKGGETATHFAGTLDTLSFNHPRKKTKSLTVKVRKTRSVMGVHKDYRPTLHSILRGSGQLVLREMANGEWEVAAFADDLADDIFGKLPMWRADKKPKLAKPSPFIDTKADAAALVKLINDYRASIKLPRIPVSAAMTKVAEAHVRDLNENKPVTESCNMHSWSKKGSWSACCYDSSKEAAKCMWQKPKEIAGYKGNGYEIAATASGITAEKALDLWQNSPAHHHVMINKEQWNKPWLALGVAVEGDYAVAWFGEKTQ